MGPIMYRLTGSFGFFDALPLECDGMMHVASALLARDGISHRAVQGSLTVDGVGTIGHHYWIVLASGQILDLRARMWLRHNDRVPHGVFVPGQGVHYREAQDVSPRRDKFTFLILAGRVIEEAPSLLELAEAANGLSKVMV